MVIIKEKCVLSFIIEGLRKRKFNIIFKNSNRVISLFLQFLTISKIIYGFTFYGLTFLHIFLKKKYPFNNQNLMICLKESNVPRRFIFKFVHFKKKNFT